MTPTPADELSARLIEVLAALARPDPSPPFAIDSPAIAVHRRVAGMPVAACAEALRELYGRGLVTVSAPATIVSSGLTQHPDEWLTTAGWLVLRAAGLDGHFDNGHGHGKRGAERPW